METLMEKGWIFSRLYCSDPHPELWLTNQGHDSPLQLLDFGKIFKDRGWSAQKSLHSLFQGEMALKKSSKSDSESRGCGVGTSFPGQKKAAEGWWEELMSSLMLQNFEVFVGQVRVGIKKR